MSHRQIPGAPRIELLAIGVHELSGLGPAHIPFAVRDVDHPFLHEDLEVGVPVEYSAGTAVKLLEVLGSAVYCVDVEVGTVSRSHPEPGVPGGPRCQDSLGGSVVEVKDFAPLVEAPRIARRLWLPAGEVEVPLDRPAGLGDAIDSEGDVFRREGKYREMGGRWGGSVVRAVGERRSGANSTGQCHDDHEYEKKSSLPRATAAGSSSPKPLHVRQPSSRVRRMWTVYAQPGHTPTPRFRTRHSRHRVPRMSDRGSLHAD